MNRRELSRAYSQTLLVTGRQWRRLADRVAERHGLSEATALPLVMIARSGNAARQHALAEAMGIEGPSLMRPLDRCEKAGLVVRAVDPGDRRAKVLSLALEGERFVAGMEIELDRSRAAMFGDVDPDEPRASLRVFRTVRDFAARAAAAAPGMREAAV